MSQKAFTILFLGVTMVAVVGLLINKSQQSGSASSPSPSGLVFNGLSGSPSPALQQSQSSTSLNQTQIKQFKGFPLLPQSQLQNKKAVIQTAKGTIEFDLFPEASMAASNFIFLAQNNFYDGLDFHRVVPGFVVQGGDPKGDGNGGPGYHFPDELGDQEPYNRGIVAMANAWPNTNGSQFFIMLADHPELPHQYTIFGKVTSGMDVVDKIEVGDIMQKVTIESQ